MLKIISFMLVVLIQSCGENKVYPHPSTSILNIEKCAKEKNLSFAKTGADLLVELDSAKKRNEIKEYDKACLNDDNFRVRNFLQCLSYGCNKYAKTTDLALSLVFMDEILKGCKLEFEAFNTIKNSDCVAWKNKLSSLLGS